MGKGDNLVLNFALFQIFCVLLPVLYFRSFEHRDFVFLPYKNFQTSLFLVD